MGTRVKPADDDQVCEAASQPPRASFAGLDREVRGEGARRNSRPNLPQPYARVPLNGKLPLGPMPISPEMLSPETLPVKSSVSGIGLVMEIFQATSSPFAVPSKISATSPSAPCVPVSVPPEFFKLSVALRSPIGVLMVMFQFPSTAIVGLSSRFSSQNRNGSGIRQGSRGGIAHLAAHANRYPPRIAPGAGFRPRTLAIRR